MSRPGEQPPPNMAEMNPMMMDALKQITPEALPMFLISNPQFVPEKYGKRFQKSIVNLSTYVVFGTIGGIFANVQLKRISLKFLTLPVVVRYPMRLVIFALPFGLLYPKINQNVMVLNENLFRIHMKIMKLHRTGNIEQYFNED